MKIVLLIACSLIFSLMACSYIAYAANDSGSNKLSNFVRAIISNRRRFAYVLSMLIVLTALSVVFPLVYGSNALIQDVKLLFLLAVIFAAAWFDQRENIIPNKLIVFSLAVRVAFYIVELVVKPSAFWGMLKSDLIACLIAVAFLVLGVLVIKNGLGMGDVKLIFVMCLFQGFYGAISSVFFSLVVAFVLSIVLLIAKKKTRKDTVPFAPSLLIGTALSVFLTGM